MNALSNKLPSQHLLSDRLDSNQCNFHYHSTFPLSYGCINQAQWWESNPHLQQTTRQEHPPRIVFPCTPDHAVSSIAVEYQSWYNIPTFVCWCSTIKLLWNKYGFSTLVVLQKPQKIPTPIDFRISNVIVNALFTARLVTETHLVSYATGNWCGHH